MAAGTQTNLWQQSFSYDTFGNISKFGSNGVLMAGYSPANNQIVSGITVAYDANGNIQQDDQHQYLWDASGNIASVDQSINNTYDALGRVAEQSNSGGYTQTLYAPWGDKIALITGNSLQKAYVPMSGGATAVYTSTGLTYYRHPDWLGSSRFASTPSRTLYYSGAYAPFGESYSEAGTTDRSFTGQNQDTVAGLYDFPTRGYSPEQGRWLSPDKAGLAAADPGDPQSWNRYAYVKNKPLHSVDPLGEEDLNLCSPDCSGSTDNSGDDSGDSSDSLWNDIGNFFDDIFSFFGGGGGHGGGRSSHPPVSIAKGYTQSSVSSGDNGTLASSIGSSGSVANDPGVPTPANNVLNAWMTFWSPVDKAVAWTDQHPGVVIPAAIGAFVLGNANPLEEDAAVVEDKVSSASSAIQEWLGPGFKSFPSTSDLALKSLDGMRRVRFDLINSHGDLPHINIQTFQMRNLYPGDLRWIETMNEHIYPK